MAELDSTSFGRKRIKNPSCCWVRLLLFRAARPLVSILERNRGLRRAFEEAVRSGAGKKRGSASAQPPGKVSTTGYPKGIDATWRWKTGVRS